MELVTADRVVTGRPGEVLDDGGRPRTRGTASSGWVESRS